MQVAKDPLGTKAARITTHISLPGRRVVYPPTFSHRGVSRRIEDPAERERLRELVETIDPKGGVIVRTAGEGATEGSLRADLDYLNRLWQDVQKAYEKRNKPGLVHAEPDVELRALRDSLTEDVDRVVTDDEETHKKILAFLSQFMPRFKNKVALYKEARPLFDQYEIDIEISRSLERKIWLKSGGYIVIDEAEALVVIDVNTGRYVGKRDLEDTILKTNLEAVREIAHQLRIRNCGGITIIDFIDMEREAHREKVLESLREELARDPAKVEVTPVSSTANTVAQALYFVDKSQKKDLLSYLLKDKKINSALIFTKTKHGADRVARVLNQSGVLCAAIHGNKSQNARQSSLSSFKYGRIRVLVPTDIAARGLDIDDLTHVINYDLPNIAETYVHRIGRTGRAGASGIALSFCDQEEKAYLRDIHKLRGKPIPVVEEHPYVLAEGAGPVYPVSRPVIPAVSTSSPHHNSGSKWKGRR